MVTKGGSDSGGRFAATRAAERIAEMLAEKFQSSDCKIPKVLEKLGRIMLLVLATN